MGGVGADGRRMQAHLEYGISRGMDKEAMESGGSGLDLSYFCGFWLHDYGTSSKLFSSVNMCIIIFTMGMVIVPSYDRQKHGLPKISMS